MSKGVNHHEGYQASRILRRFVGGSHRVVPGLLPSRGHGGLLVRSLLPGRSRHPEPKSEWRRWGGCRVLQRVLWNQNGSPRVWQQQYYVDESGWWDFQGARQSVHLHVRPTGDRKSTRLNSSHGSISYAVFCLKKKKK